MKPPSVADIVPTPHPPRNVSSPTLTLFALFQTEFAPVGVVEQIGLLLALTEGLFDGVPLDRMREAEQALSAAATRFPPEARARLVGNHKLEDADRAAVLAVARQTLAPFQQKP